MVMRCSHCKHGKSNVTVSPHHHPQALLIDYCAMYMGYKSTHIMNATCDPAFRHIFAIRYGLYIGRLLFLCPRVAK